MHDLSPPNMWLVHVSVKLWPLTLYHYYCQEYIAKTKQQLCQKSHTPPNHGCGHSVGNYQQPTTKLEVHGNHNYKNEVMVIASYDSIAIKSVTFDPRNHLRISIFIWQNSQVGLCNLQQSILIRWQTSSTSALQGHSFLWLPSGGGLVPPPGTVGREGPAADRTGGGRARTNDTKGKRERDR